MRLMITHLSIKGNNFQLRTPLLKNNQFRELIYSVLFQISKFLQMFHYINQKSLNISPNLISQIIITAIQFKQPVYQKHFPVLSISNKNSFLGENLTLICPKLNKCQQVIIIAFFYLKIHQLEYQETIADISLDCNIIAI